MSHDIVTSLAHKFADSGADNEDAIFEELERFDEEKYREQRVQELDRELKTLRQLSGDHGKYLEIKEEKKVLDLTTTEDFVVVHFFHPEFKRCEIMHRHLEILAKRHFKTRFVKVNVENVPFLVTRLGIQVLPCVIPFVKAIGRERLIGFENLGGDDFKTSLLEMALRKSGVIQSLRGEQALKKTNIMGFASGSESDSD